MTFYLAQRVTNLVCHAIKLVVVDGSRSYNSKDFYINLWRFMMVLTRHQISLSGRTDYLV